MPETEDLTSPDSHFAFGANWASYSRLIGDKEINEAIEGLRRLLGESIRGSRFLDIGCGSGLHALAAARLGAREVVCVDIDPQSIATTRMLLSAHGISARVELCSVFELGPAQWGRFDVVYSWGVLHHTGDMYRALRNAAAIVAPGGLFSVALYRKTWLCPFWRWEKRRYKGWSESAQGIARRMYEGLYFMAKTLQGVEFRSFIKNYRGSRGMDFYHDVHDWLGGYPYESILPTELNNLMNEMDFELTRSFRRSGHVFGRELGLLGSGCDEFVYRSAGARE